jgi:hypothetical protein
VNNREVVEEVVVDRYAALDAQKRQGRLPSPPASPAAGSYAARPVNISTAVEKSLAAAETLVEHAATMEQAGWVDPVPSGLLSSEMAVGGASEAWTSAVVHSPGCDQTPEPIEHPREALTINLPATDNCEALHEACLQLKPEDEEPELIVIDDDPPALAIQVQPQATPVKKQEYRQLFARLRRS